MCPWVHLELNVWPPTCSLVIQASGFWAITLCPTWEIVALTCLTPNLLYMQVSIWVFLLPTEVRCQLMSPPLDLCFSITLSPTFCTQNIHHQKHPPSHILQWLFDKFMQEFYKICCTLAYKAYIEKSINIFLTCRRNGRTHRQRQL